jgi:hypothetical protein
MSGTQSRSGHSGEEKNPLTVPRIESRPSSTSLCRLSYSVTHSSRLYRPFLDPGRLFSFVILYKVGRTCLKGDQPVARPLPPQNTNRIKADMHASSGIRTQDPVFEQAKTVHAAGHAANVICRLSYFSP